MKNIGSKASLGVDAACVSVSVSMHHIQDYAPGIDGTTIAPGTIVSVSPEAGYFIVDKGEGGGVLL